MDCDILGLRLRDKEHADVALAVNWQRIDDSEMRSTELVQHWTDHKGTWLLETEDRAAATSGSWASPPPSSARPQPALSSRRSRFASTLPLPRLRQ